MRYHAPSREAVEPAVFDRLPLAAWREYAALLQGHAWPSIEQLNSYLPKEAGHRFVVGAEAAFAPAICDDPLR